MKMQNVEMKWFILMSCTLYVQHVYWLNVRKEVLKIQRGKIKVFPKKYAHHSYYSFSSSF